MSAKRHNPESKIVTVQPKRKKQKLNPKSPQEIRIFKERTIRIQKIFTIVKNLDLSKLFQLPHNENVPDHILLQISEFSLGVTVVF